MNRNFYYKELYKFTVEKIKSTINGTLLLFSLFFGLHTLAIVDVNAASGKAPKTTPTPGGNDIGDMLNSFRCAVDGYVGPILGFILVFVIMSLAYKVIMSGGGRPSDGSQGLSVSTLLTIGVALAVLMLASNFSEAILTGILPKGSKALANVTKIFVVCP